MSKQHILDIAKKLARTIPAPFRPEPRSAQSWRTLRKGQCLASKNIVLELPVGTIWTVVEVTNQGVRLNAAGTVEFWLQIPEWQGHFERVRKTRRRKCDTA